MTPSFVRTRTLPPAWRVALIGTLASLPLTVVVNWLPDAEVNLAGGIGIIGAFIAGFIAATRSMEPDAAGSRAGLLGGSIAVLAPITTGVSTAIENAAVTWPTPSETVFFVGATVALLCLAPAFGLVCGRIGGWVATTIATQWSVDAS
jgi:uncharacterized membrane protein YeaQ/YmgE (transglycosylase-associated protein family)